MRVLLINDFWHTYASLIIIYFKGYLRSKWTFMCIYSTGWSVSDVTYHTTYCARCCGVTAMFVSHALAPPRVHAAESPVNPPFTLHGHPSRSYSNCSEVHTLTSCIQRFTFLTSQMDHPVDCGEVRYPLLPLRNHYHVFVSYVSVCLRTYI
jgi:hypothetical protein